MPSSSYFYYNRFNDKIWAQEYSLYNRSAEFKNRVSQQPCITKRFVSISTRLIKGDTVRLIFLTCITMTKKKKMQHLKATSTTSFFGWLECGWFEDNLIFCLQSSYRENRMRSNVVTKRHEDAITNSFLRRWLNAKCKKMFQLTDRISIYVFIIII